MICAGVTCCGRFVRGGDESSIYQEALSNDELAFKEPEQLLMLAGALIWLILIKLAQYAIEMRALYLLRGGLEFLEGTGTMRGAMAIRAKRVRESQRGWAARKSMLAQRFFVVLEYVSLQVNHAENMGAERLEHRLSYLTDRYAIHAHYWQVFSLPSVCDRCPCSKPHSHHFLGTPSL